MTTQDDNQQSEVTQDTVVEEPTSSISETTEIFLEDQDTDFINSLAEEYRNEPSLKAIKDINALAKSYIHSQKELGSRIRIPSKEATPEQRQAFLDKLKDIDGVVHIPDQTDPEYNDKITSIYDRLGRPPAPTEYNLTLPEDVALDEDFVSKFKDTAHKIGLNQNQINALVPLEIDRINAMKNILETQKQQTVEFFKKEWGSEFESNLKVAKATLNKYAELYPEAVADVKLGYAGTNPVVIDMLYQIGKMNQEDPIMSSNETNRASNLTTESISAKIMEMRRDSQHPLNIANHPDHDRAVEELNALYRQASQVAKDNS